MRRITLSVVICVAALLVVVSIGRGQPEPSLLPPSNGPLPSIKFPEDLLPPPPPSPPDSLRLAILPQPRLPAPTCAAQGVPSLPPRTFTAAEKTIVKVYSVPDLVADIQLRS